MPAGHLSIGERLYLFSSNAGQRTCTSCTIDAHGEQTIFSGQFPLRTNLTVRFYVEQGAALAYHQGRKRIGTPDEYAYSNSLEAIAKGVATEAEHFTGPGNCPNYNLRKIQKSNGGLLGGRWSNWIDERSNVNYSSLERFITHDAPSSDIITIRNRAGKLAITLGDVIAALPVAYTEIRCCFCRSNQAPWQPSVPNRQVTGAARPGGGQY